MSGPRFISRVPLYIFNQKGIEWQSSRFLLAMFKDYVLYGVKCYVDDDTGEMVSHKFDEVKDEETFLMPSAVLVLLDKREVSMEHYHAFAYLCYLAHLQRSHVVRINKDYIKNRTGLSKTRFQEVVQELIYHEVKLVKATGKNNQVEIPWLEPSFVEQIEQLTDEAIAIRDGKMEPKGGDTVIPTYFLHDHKKLGFSYTEAGIILTFASALSRGEPRTFEEAVQFVVDHSNEMDSFQVIAAVRKAERKGIFDLIKLNKEGHLQINWKGVEV
jgi:uncharacterized protein YdhG (YjbR/CyaY superfamily)